MLYYKGTKEHYIAPYRRDYMRYHQIFVQFFSQPTTISSYVLQICAH